MGPGLGIGSPFLLGSHAVAVVDGDVVLDGERRDC